MVFKPVEPQTLRIEPTHEMIIRLTLSEILAGGRIDDNRIPVAAPECIYKILAGCSAESQIPVAAMN